MVHKLFGTQICFLSQFSVFIFYVILEILNILDKFLSAAYVSFLFTIALLLLF